jgi:diaminopimelate decarboxylase
MSHPPAIPTSPTAAANCVEDVRVAELARQHGTPLFVYSKAAMLSALAPTSAASPAATRRSATR